MGRVRIIDRIAFAADPPLTPPFQGGETRTLSLPPLEKGGLGGDPKRVLLLVFASLAACAPAAAPNTASGYVETELLYISAQESGAVAELYAREGDKVAAGAPLFRLDTEKSDLAAASARLEADAAGSRAGDGGSLDRAVAEAAAQYDVARRNYARSSGLGKDGYETKERVDRDRAERDAAAARLARVKAERDDALKQANAMRAEADRMARRAADRTVTAPSAGVIERVYRRPGEVAAAGEPVVALLAPGAVKLRFYAPEPKLSSLSVGGLVSYACDGCPEGLKAKITYIAAEPQFTPPVIYSTKEREKLVFLVEARPEPGAPPLAKGLPVTAALP